MSSDPSSTPLPPDHGSNAGKQAPPPRKRRRLRKWLIGFGIVLLLLVVLVALAPTLIGTPPVRSMIVGRVNDSIPGNISLDGLSLGWTSGISASGLKVYDEQNALILEVPRFSTDLTLLKAIRGDLALGNTTADINATRVVIDENGVSNVERAFGLDKPTTEAEKTPRPKPKEPDGDQPTELPNVSGTIALNILGGTIEMPGTLSQPVHLQPGTIKADIKNINQAISNSGELGYRLGDAAPGTIKWTGELDIAENNQLALAKLSGSEDIQLNDINLAPISGFLPAEQKLLIEGIARGGLKLQASGTDTSLKGTIDVANFAVGGAPLNGDTYRTEALGIPIDVTRAADGKNGSRITIQALGVQSDDFTITVDGQVPEQALMNFAALKPPGDSGEIKMTIAVPGLADIANQMPNTLKLAEGVTLDKASLNSTAQVSFKPESASIAYDFAMSGNGSRDGKPVTLAPIKVVLGGNVIPLGPEKVPQVSDVKLAMDSNFAHFEGGGASLEALKLDGKIALAQMQQELGQFVDLGTLELAGDATLGLTTQGDVTKPTQPIATAVDLNMQGLTVRKTDDTGGKHEALANENIRALLNADVTLPEAGGFQADASTLSVTSASKLFSLEKVPDAKLTIVSPPGGTMQANATLKLGADLKRLMDAGAAFSATQPSAPPPAGEPGQLKSGVLDATVAIAPADQNQTSITLDGAINRLTVTTAEKPIENETVKIYIDAKSRADFARLANATIDSSFAKIVVSDADIVLSKPSSDGATTAPSTFKMVQSAKVTASVPELAKLYAVAIAFAPAEPATAPVSTEEGQTAPPPPPMQITRGSATLAMNVKREGNVTNATLSDTQINDLAITRGQASYAFTRPVVITADANVNALEALERLQVGKLNIDLGGIATVSLAEPLDLSGFEQEVPTARGTLNVDGQIEQLAKLLEALQGTPDAYPYRGQLAMTQKLGTDEAGKLSFAGQVKATDFQTFTPGQEQPTFSEKELTLENDLLVDPNTKSATINKLNINMPSSEALQIVANGKLVDWEKQRQLDGIKLDLTYDLAKLWPIIKPLLGPESQEDLKELKIAGKAKRTFTVSGSYPAVDSGGNALPFNEAIKFVVADGGVVVDSFDYKGTKIDKLEIPLSLRNGRLDTVYGDRKGAARVAPPAQCNGGLLNVGALLIDLTRPDGPRISTGKNHELLKNVTINPLFADNILGKFINPAFVNPDKAQGLLSVILVECNQVPLSALIQQNVAANDGRADIRMSIIELAIGNEFLSKLVTTLKPNAFNNNALQGNIKDARIVISDGMVTETMAIQIDEYALAFDGKVRLADQALMPLNLHIPAELLDKVGEDVLEYLPEGFSVPVTGKTTAPRLDLNVMLRQVTAAVAKAQLGNLLGGKKDEKPAPSKDGKKPSTQPAEPVKPEEQVKDILEGLLKKKK